MGKMPTTVARLLISEFSRSCELVLWIYSQCAIRCAQEAGIGAQIAIASATASSGRDLAKLGIIPGSGRAGDARLVLGEAALTAGGMNNARRAAR